MEPSVSTLADCFPFPLAPASICSCTSSNCCSLGVRRFWYTGCSNKEHLSGRTAWNWFPSAVLVASGQNGQNGKEWQSCLLGGHFGRAICAHVQRTRSSAWRNRSQCSLTLGSRPQWMAMLVVVEVVAVMLSLSFLLYRLLLLNRCKRIEPIRHQEQWSTLPLLLTVRTRWLACCRNEHWQGRGGEAQKVCPLGRRTCSDGILVHALPSSVVWLLGTFRPINCDRRPSPTTALPLHKLACFPAFSYLPACFFCSLSLPLENLSFRLGCADRCSRRRRRSLQARRPLLPSAQLLLALVYKIHRVGVFQITRHTFHYS